MDGEEVIIQQIGLILMQLRFARRALEEVERNTARYGGISFSNALAAGPRFGEPPLLNGALKVHVVNISDLNPGTSLGNLIEGILGGVGRFFGGFFGGVGAGFASVVTLPFLLSKVEQITSNINRILDQIGIIRGPGGSRPETPTTTSAGGGIDLNQFTTTLNSLASLFEAAGRGAGEGGAVQGEVPQGWLVTLYTATRLVESISRVVDGIIILIPIAIGAIASLIVRIDDLKLKLLDLIQFIVRNAFLLRGVVLVTVYDTLAGAASLGLSIMQILSTAVNSILGSIFNALTALLTLAFETLRFVGGGLQRTMNGLLEWLRTGLGTFLINIGQTDVFRLLHHLVRTLPLILPSLVVLVRDRELSPTDRTALKEAAAIRLPSGNLRGGIPAFTPFPNLETLMAPRGDVAGLMTAVDSARTLMTSAIKSGFGAAEQGLTDVQNTLDSQAKSAQGLFANAQDPRLLALQQRADALAQALQPAVDAAQQHPQTGLEAIAKAYETWISGGGLQTILSMITTHFQSTPTTGTPSERSIMGRIIAATAGVSEPPPATIRIERVEIEVAPPATLLPTPETPSLVAIEQHLLSPDFVDRLQEQLTHHAHDWEMRGGDPRFVGFPAIAPA